MTADIIDDDENEGQPYDGLTPQQRAHFDATLQRLDVTLGPVEPNTRALGRAIVEVMLYAGIHDTNSILQKLINSREELLEDISHPLKTIDNGLGLANDIAEKTMGQVDELADVVRTQAGQIAALTALAETQGAHIATLTQHLGVAPEDDPRTVMERLAAGAHERRQQGRAIRAIFALIAIALFLGLLAIAISLLLPPAAAATISGGSVVGAMVVGIRIMGG
jgi:hypothetical protein